MINVEQGHDCDTENKLVIGACKPCYQQIVIYFGGIKLAFHFGYGWENI